MRLGTLISEIKTRLTEAGFTVASYTLDLAQHVPSGPLADNAVSVHPDSEIRQQPIRRKLHEDTLTVRYVFRLQAKHDDSTFLAWDHEEDIRAVVEGSYSQTAMVRYSATPQRGYHPTNKGWYLITQTFLTIREAY